MERLAQSDRGNAGWQRDLSSDSLAIRDRLAQSDRGNAGWQRDLSVSYDNVGDVQVAQRRQKSRSSFFRRTTAVMRLKRPLAGRRPSLPWSGKAGAEVGPAFLAPRLRIEATHSHNKPSA